MSGPLSIGFLGAGKMASALAQGWIRAGLVARESVLGGDVSAAAREEFARATGARVVPSNAEVVAGARIVVVAVKPGQVPDVLHGVRNLLSPSHLVLSIAAGVTLAQLEAALPAGARVGRLMPNTPAMVGASATAFTPGRGATAEDAAVAQQLFGALGVALAVPETLLDAVTGISGSGPAYACLMIEALSDGGVAAGLPREVATRLAAQTLLGTAKMVLESGLHPGVLKDQVTSPGGSTIEGLHELEKGGVRAALISAVRAAADKSRRLGQG